MRLSQLSRWLTRVALTLLPIALADRLRTWRLSRAIRGFRSYVANHNYCGFPLRVAIADPLAEAWYNHDWEQLPELELLKTSCLRRGSNVFDLGAHQGVVASVLACIVGPSGRVIAVEANEHNCRMAKRNQELNKLDQLTIVHAAVAAHNGVIGFRETLNGQLTSTRTSPGKTSVKCLTIDQLAKDYGVPALVFIDVEGAECLALSGSAETLASTTDFFVEVHVGCGLEELGGSVEKVLQFFPREEFVLFARRVRESTFVPFCEDNEAIVSEHFFLIALRRKTDGVC